MTFKLLAALVLVAFGAWGFYGVRDVRHEREANLQRERVLQEEKILLASRHGAIPDWESRLPGDVYERFTPILTKELESVWLREKPILFVGAIRDIASRGEQDYQVTVAIDWQAGGAELRLILDTPKQKIDAFLQAHPDLLRKYSLGEHLGIVAKIVRITSEESDGGLLVVRTGHGELLEIALLDPL